MTTNLPLIIVCDWIPPAFGAVGQYEMARAQEAARTGRDVTLIGLGLEANAETHQIGNGKLTIVRIAAQPADKASLFKRVLWALAKNSALLSATAKAAKAHRACEIKVTGSPPFLSYQVLLWRSFNRRRSITYRVTDFYPETVFAAGKAKALRPFTPLIHALRKRADRIEALSACQKRRLMEGGMREDRIEIIRDASPVAFGVDTKPAARPFREGDAVLLYSGNLGVAHPPHPSGRSLLGLCLSLQDVWLPGQRTALPFCRSGGIRRPRPARRRSAPRLCAQRRCRRRGNRTSWPRYQRPRRRSYRIELRLRAVLAVHQAKHAILSKHAKAA